MDDTKTEFITFGTSNLLSKMDFVSITVGGIPFHCPKSVKFLDVVLDDTLSFRQHVVA